MTKFILSIIVFSATFQTMAQKTIPLYSESIPNSKPSKDEEFTDTLKGGILIVHKISRPTLTIYLPEHPAPGKQAMIIFPGGGYFINATSHEGHDVAKELAKNGIAAFVVKYRIPDTATMINKEIGPLQDAQQAILTVRSNAKKWNINPLKIGVMGFSAGGHLASTLATHYQKSLIPNPEKISLRPDFLGLIYPVVSFKDSVGHIGSRGQLIGPNATAEKIDEYCNELHVDKDTPPSFLVHAKDDPIKIENSLVFIESLKKFNIPYETVFYEKGGHGYGMINPTSEIKWMDQFIPWIKNH